MYASVHNSHANYLIIEFLNSKDVPHDKAQKQYVWFGSKARN